MRNANQHATTEQLLLSPSLSDSDSLHWSLAHYCGVSAATHLTLDTGAQDFIADFKVHKVASTATLGVNRN